MLLRNTLRLFSKSNNNNKNVLKYNNLFNINQYSFSKKNLMNNSNVDMTKYDSKQVEFMNEECIVVNENDQCIGVRSKKDCHLMSNINNDLLHRAFSCFLFNEKNELLLQQRADEKITFPGYWTNTVCSHPLYFSNPDSKKELKYQPEMELENNLGVKRAARRKLEHELGVPSSLTKEEDYEYLTRIIYKSASNDIWGEYEIDHIVFLRMNDVQLNINKNEVKDYKFVSQDELRNFLNEYQSKGIKITPWFQLIAKHFLFNWWENIESLDQFVDYKTIHTFDE
eukprot:TRINITY_DN9599_c0_g1_i1.p1 TRINITY_DN9599_c0_g1~~TRINITY_DN9599_c0_g1_i1.p1  ORF type:complete len:283 (+),score=74.94 TRINITY_DN9599_c0_g1_i1:20-868(+)